MSLASCASSPKNHSRTRSHHLLISHPSAPTNDSVFGKVVKGMEIIQQIAQVPVDSKDKPIEDVRIVNCGELIKKSAVGVQPVVTPTPAETRGRGRTRSISPSRSRSRSRSPSTSSSRSRSPSRDRKRSRKSSSRREKKDKKERRRKLKGLVDDYGTEAGAGGKEREETEEELDARSVFPLLSRFFLFSWEVGRKYNRLILPCHLALAGNRPTQTRTGRDRTTGRGEKDQAGRAETTVRKGTRGKASSEQGGRGRRL